MKPLDVPSWNATTTFPALEKSEAHVWRVRVSEATAAQLERMLRDDERARADRYRFAADRARFVCGRGGLRILLAQYLGQAPRTLRFNYNAQDKPTLDAAVEFNVAHAEDIVLLAFAREFAVGVDVETKRPGLNELEIAARFFTPAEIRALEQRTDDERAKYFLYLWTRKEALSKALGVGIAEGLTQPPDTKGWEIYSFEPAPKYAAALAIRGAGHQIRFFDFAGLI